MSRTVTASNNKTLERREIDLTCRIPYRQQCGLTKDPSVTRLEGYYISH